MMVVSPAICGTVISRFGTEEQKQRWLPGLADGTATMAFAHHRARRRHQLPQPHHHGSPRARRRRLAAHRPQDLRLRRRRGRRACWSSARTEDARTGRLKPCLFVVPTDADGFEFRRSRWRSSRPRSSSAVFLDDVRLPADALVGDADAGLAQLFAGLNPERIMAARSRPGWGGSRCRAPRRTRRSGRLRGPRSGRTRGSPTRWPRPHRGRAGRLMTQKAATLYEAGDDTGAGEAANMAKYAAAEAACHAVDQAVQTHGGNGMTQEYGMAGPDRRRPGRPDRPGQPGDDPQLRRHALAGPAQVLLRPAAQVDPAEVQVDPAEVQVDPAEVHELLPGQPKLPDRLGPQTRRTSSRAMVAGSPRSSIWVIRPWSIAKENTTFASPRCHQATAG